jgi:hypothetical protein
MAQKWVVGCGLWVVYVLCVVCVCFVLWCDVYVRYVISTQIYCSVTFVERHCTSRVRRVENIPSPVLE